MQYLIDFVNRIGQRRAAKIITILSLFFGGFNYLMQYGIGHFLTYKPYIGLFLLAIPHYYLSEVAEIDHKYRLFSLVTSLIIVFVNFVLFLLQLGTLLFFVTLAEYLLTLYFYRDIKKNKNTQKQTDLAL